jgi:hypothetical protein
VLECDSVVGVALAVPAAVWLHRRYDLRPRWLEVGWHVAIYRGACRERWTAGPVSSANPNSRKARRGNSRATGKAGRQLTLSVW